MTQGEGEGVEEDEEDEARSGYETWSERPCRASGEGANAGCKAWPGAWGLLRHPNRVWSIAEKGSRKQARDAGRSSECSKE